MNFDYDAHVRLIIDAAKKEAKMYSHAYLTPEHVLFSALRFRDIQLLFSIFRVDIVILEQEISEYLSHIGENIRGAEPTYSPGFRKLIELSCLNCSKDHGRDIIMMRDLMVSLVDIEDVQDTHFLKSRNITSPKVVSVMTNEYFEKRLKRSIDGEHIEDELDELFDAEEEIFQDYEIDEDEDEEGDAIIPRLTTNLTEKALAGEFDSLIGQDHIINDVFEILIRRKKNNALIVGDPGVGKTAIVNEIANRIVQGNVPDDFKDCTILSLDIVALVAGTRYRGDFEDRVRQLTDVLVSSKKYILFLDEIHTILGAGSSAGNSNDFGDLIKPILVDGIVRCIGATTHEEYKRFERERALLRRFHIVHMRALTQESTLHVLSHLREKYENFYNISYSDKVLKTIVDLTDKYVTERSFPDKAIDVLDAAGSYVKIRRLLSQNKRKRRQEVTVSHIEEIVSKITKRPLQSVKKNEFAHLLKIQSHLSRKIYGQDHAIQKISKIIRRSKAGLRDLGKPVASFLFVGPTGVGKTELSKQLAKELRIHFRRFDMSEYQEKHSISKFIGSPPGYVGHDQGGLLIDCIRHEPHTVLLLDEIEKAHIDIFNLLLQIMDYATITDSLGRKADFRNVILIMTSNAGAQESVKPFVGFENSQIKGRVAIFEEIERTFSPEFRNRLDDIIIFNTLNVNHVHKIVKKELNIIKNKLKKHAITLEWGAGVEQMLTMKGYSPMFGARNVLRMIASEVNDVLANKVLAVLVKKNAGHVRLHLSLDKSKKLIIVHDTIENVL